MLPTGPTTYLSDDRVSCQILDRSEVRVFDISDLHEADFACRRRLHGDWYTPFLVFFISMFHVISSLSRFAHGLIFGDTWTKITTKTKTKTYRLYHQTNCTCPVTIFAFSFPKTCIFFLPPLHCTSTPLRSLLSRSNCLSHAYYSPLLIYAICDTPHSSTTSSSPPRDTVHTLFDYPVISDYFA